MHAEGGRLAGDLGGVCFARQDRILAEIERAVPQNATEDIASMAPGAEPGPEEEGL